MSQETILDFLRTIKDHRHYLWKLIVGVGIITAVITLCIPNKYKSQTTFYAASDDLSRPDVLFGISAERTYYYGGKNEQERFLALAESQVLIDSVLNRFDLFEHYGIEGDGPLQRFKVSKKFSKHFSLIRNEFDLLQLSFTDRDPEVSAEIANGTREILNNMVSGIIYNNQLRFVQSLDKKISNTSTIIQATNDSILMLRSRFQIYDPDNTIAQISELLTTSKNMLSSEKARLQSYSKMHGVRQDTLNNIRARIEGLTNQIRSIEAPDSSSQSGLNIAQINQVTPQIKSLESRYYAQRAELVRDEVQLSKLKLTLEARPPSILLVESAHVPLKKISPRRTLTVLLSMIIASVLYCVGLLLYQGYKRSMTQL